MSCSKANAPRGKPKKLKKSYFVRARITHTALSSTFCHCKIFKKTSLFTIFTPANPEPRSCFFLQDIFLGTSEISDLRRSSKYEKITCLRHLGETFHNVRARCAAVCKKRPLVFRLKRTLHPTHWGCEPTLNLPTNLKGCVSAQRPATCTSGNP